MPRNFFELGQAGAACAFVLGALLACGSSSRVNPAFAKSAAPAPLVAFPSSYCPPGGTDLHFAKGATVAVGFTPLGRSAAAALESAVQERARIVASPDGSCFIADLDNYKSDEFRVAVPASVREAMSQTGAESALVTAVATFSKCSENSVGSDGVYVRTGTSDCWDSDIRFFAYVITKDGTVVWKGYDRRVIDSRPVGGDPSFDGTARGLVASAPLSTSR